MMRPITVRILMGENAGRARTFQTPHLTFGRDAQNMIVVEAPQASRQHGELGFADDGQWYVVNRSANGTTVNGKAIGQKPAMLKSGDKIGVGRDRMFEVEIPEPAEEQQPAPFAQADLAAHPDKPKMTAKSKLWMGIGIYLVIMAVVIVVLASLRGNDDVGNDGLARQLSPSEIEAEIKSPLDAPTSERDARAALAQALQFYQLRDRVDEPGALYHAYVNFKLAYAYSPDLLGDSIREFDQAEKELIRRVQETYRHGYARLRDGSWNEAARTFQRLTRIYPASGSMINRNAHAQWSIARRNSPSR